MLLPIKAEASLPHRLRLLVLVGDNASSRKITGSSELMIELLRFQSVLDLTKNGHFGWDFVPEAGLTLRETRVLQALLSGLLKRLKVRVCLLRLIEHQEERVRPAKYPLDRIHLLVHCE